MTLSSLKLAQLLLRPVLTAILDIRQKMVHWHEATFEVLYSGLMVTKTQQSLGCVIFHKDFGISDDVINNTFIRPSGRKRAKNTVKYIGSNSTRLDSTRSTLSSQSSKSRRACRARRAVLFQHGGRRTILYKFSRFYALAYTNPICFIK